MRKAWVPRVALLRQSKRPRSFGKPCILSCIGTEVDGSWYNPRSLISTSSDGGGSFWTGANACRAITRCVVMIVTLHLTSIATSKKRAKTDIKKRWQGWGGWYRVWYWEIIYRLMSLFKGVRVTQPDAPRYWNPINRHIEICSQTPPTILGIEIWNQHMILQVGNKQKRSKKNKKQIRRIKNEKTTAKPPEIWYSISL